MVARLLGFSGSRKPANLVDAFTCLSADVIGSYAFGRSYGFLNHPDFCPGWHKLMMDLSRSTHLMKQFGWLYQLLRIIPQSLVAFLHPVTGRLFDIQRDIRYQVKELRSSGRGQQKDLAQHTILQDLFRSKLPPEELTDDRLTDEGITLLGAGTVTTAHALSVISYHLLAQPSKLSILRAELTCAHGSGDSTLSWQQLERLPYLSAVVAEGLRMSYGVSHRLQRIHPDYHITLGSQTVPAGTPVSMSQMDMHENANIFHEPSTFKPERWLTNDAVRLRKYLVPFSRGTRQCAGLNLAYAEIFLTLGAVFSGKLILELFETDRSDVDCAHDFFNPSAKLDSKGVRVLVN